jgi:hypothetical protein
MVRDPAPTSARMRSPCCKPENASAVAGYCFPAHGDVIVPARAGDTFLRLVDGAFDVVPRQNEIANQAARAKPEEQRAEDQACSAGSKTFGSSQFASSEPQESQNAASKDDSKQVDIERRRCGLAAQDVK